MSDDLLKRLCSLHKQATVERSHFYVGSCAKDAMHRIEELEAKLAADRTEVIALIRKDAENGDISHGAAQWVINTILAELKEQDDDE